MARIDLQRGYSSFSLTRLNGRNGRIEHNGVDTILLIHYRLGKYRVYDYTVYFFFFNLIFETVAADTSKWHLHVQNIALTTKEGDTAIC
jgi:hypothetical protein